MVGEGVRQRLVFQEIAALMELEEEEEEPMMILERVVRVLQAPAIPVVQAGEQITMALEVLQTPGRMAEREELPAD